MCFISDVSPYTDTNVHQVVMILVSKYQFHELLAIATIVLFIIACHESAGLHKSKFEGTWYSVLYTVNIRFFVVLLSERTSGEWPPFFGVSCSSRDWLLVKV